MDAATIVSVSGCMSNWMLLREVSLPGFCKKSNCFFCEMWEGLDDARYVSSSGCCEMCVSVCVQACHDLVPPEWLQPIIRHLCNQFVHDRARPEEICVGLKTVREICMRMPLIMSEEMLLVCPLLCQ